MKVLLVAAVLFVGTQAFADRPTMSAEVKGWHSCQYPAGDLFWYRPCHVEGVYDTGDCDFAYEEIKKIDCCSETGGYRYSFHKISCQLRYIIYE